MPRPADSRSTYVPGLDGVRAIAVAAVVAYHLGVRGAQGGLLGVGVFFTLSGFLITGLLVSSWERSGSLSLRTFWVRRARRLLPAVVLVLVTVLMATALVDPAAITHRAGQSLAALFYVANWSTIAGGDSYFQRIQAPGPLDHLWSLSIEEQFYLVWPLLLGLLLVLLRGRLRAVAAVTVILAGASFALLGVLARSGFDHTRAYEGTDTRAGGLLLGAALALVWPSLRRRGTAGPARRALIDLVGAAGLAGIGALIATTNQYDDGLYHGGLLLLSICTVALVAAVACPGSLTGRALGVAPLRWIGERSYGIYLWHMPVIALSPDQALGARSVTRDLLQVLVTVVLAALSWTLVEDPIRRRGVKALRRRRRLAPGQPRRTSMHPRVPAIPVFVALAAATLWLVDTRATTAASAAGHGAQGSSALVAQRVAPAATPAAVPADVRPQTRCRAVIHVGDSTSDGLVSRSYLPRARDRIGARYAQVGVRHFVSEISGARSIVEPVDGQPNADAVVTRHVRRGYHSCWVFALGTNDAADVAVGSAVSLHDRIERLMRRVAGAPVLWLTVRTLRNSGPYAETEMEKWNQALAQACEHRRNMRVYDWAAEVRPGWFIDDGIHFTSAGYRQRARRIARALALAFPRTGPPPSGCLITTH